MGIVEGGLVVEMEIRIWRSGIYVRNTIVNGFVGENWM